MYITFGSYLILFIFYLSIKTVESRSLDGSDNNLLFPDKGKPAQPYLREFPPDPFYPDGKGKMLKSPDSSMIKCTDPLPKGTYPSPRCIFNQFTYNLSPLDVERKSELRSKRKISHMTTWFGQYISFDISASRNEISSTPLYIPADDANYNSPNSIPITKSLPFNITGPNTLDTTDTLNSVRNGVDVVTPFLDLNMIYGLSDDQLANLRDGTSCKLLTSNNGKYPSKDADGAYKLGISTKRALTLFTLAINTVWIREHNHQCDELFKVYGNSWNDQRYFEEARRWTIALYQKTVSEEYIGVITGRPLPPYEGYKPDIIPGIDTFFSTVTFRYGHSELSDTYRIQDKFGDTVVDLTLSQIRNQSLLETFGLNSVLRSMALQRQEEIDIFFSDSIRNFISIEPNVYDLPAFDILRSRDRGIALYNTVREAYGLSRKNTWSEVTSNEYLQNKLQSLYPNGPDTAESFVGALCENHLEGSNFGELLNKSIVTQFNRIRETDRFWWESPEMFNESERSILRDTTFHDIIVRNLKIDDNSSQFIRNLWMVQPNNELVSEDDKEFKTKIDPWALYTIRYRLDNTHIHFKIEFQTAGGEGWFGMGFDPSDTGMKDAEFIVGIVKNQNIDLSNYVAAKEGYHPPTKQSLEGLEIKNGTVVTPDGKATVIFSRLLEPPNRKKIRREQMKYIMAYNPMSSAFGYHEHNRQMILINFYTNEISASSGLQNTRFFHGLGMFLAWCVSVSTFGAAAMATMANTRSPHAWFGINSYMGARYYCFG
ncbi:heme peroxidase [Rhizophagus irregularis DAOM 181602=DAOM 197198]|uniref:Heme peroxidase n=1 Tax=Rhizophagus irregularis (strain DAOM 181602 / DAOM 197198 / MUCL 43194) TaxID=747089 RepID=A0A2P4PII4_RHIID|nr:heme peroxidase [Rhizophagus irregularis DAOM 181602=DAOM 197198]POG65167.1 heme peroxidase [Rhizophagus irregularis DAOM 181602=DAOM 197198]|eukprot:XP_025172033.1 heme peroxidase [Rhizophagus irregularis DAOM 181602=DAOM 197198]